MSTTIPPRRSTGRSASTRSVVKAAACVLGALLLTLRAPGSAPAQEAQVVKEELRAFHRSPNDAYMSYTDAANALYHHLADQAQLYLRQRAEAVARLDSRQDWLDRQQRVRETLQEVVGPFPERTPLNARVVGTLQRDGIRVEKLIYETVPGFHVTAALFLPADAEEPRPGIVYFSGHAGIAFRSPTYQHVILNLVRKGFVVLAIDPVGQGERLEYVEPVQDTVVGPNTKHHSYSGAQLFLTGSSQARRMTWDGIRAIDYLVTRPEVDPARIGVTGRSGGGTQSAYVAAFDERVLAAALENYITSFRRLWQNRGPQDAEQNFYHGIARGLDHADLLLARAPRPTLLLTTTRDIFSIQGARESFAEMQPAFAALGSAGALQMVEDDAGHASTLANREAMYAFFQEALTLPGDPQDEVVVPFPTDSLRITRTGLVATSLEGETTFSLHRAAAAERLGALRAARQEGEPHLRRVVLEARRLSGYEDPGAPEEPIFMGRYQRDGYAVEKYVLPVPGGYPQPYLLMVPDGPGPHPAVVYLHADGKEAHAAPGGEMERLARAGYVVAAPDLVGSGELGPGLYRGDSYNVDVGKAPYGMWFGAVMVGESFVGLQAADVVRLVRALRTRSDVAAEPVRAIAYGTATPVLQYVAAFEPEIGGIALVQPLVSYGSMAMTKYYRPEIITGAVAGMLTAYDLPDLTAAIAPREVLLLGSVDAKGHAIPAEDLREQLAVALDRYAELGAMDALGVRDLTGREAGAAVLSWLQLTAPRARQTAAPRLLEAGQ